MSTGVTVAGGAERFLSIGGTITALALMVSTRTSWQYWQSPPSRQLSTPSPHAEPNRDLSSTSTAREAPRAEERGALPALMGSRSRGRDPSVALPQTATCGPLNGFA